MRRAARQCNGRRNRGEAARGGYTAWIICTAARGGRFIKAAIGGGWRERLQQLALRRAAGKQSASATGPYLRSRNSPDRGEELCSRACRRRNGSARSTGSGIHERRLFREIPWPGI